jgi:hypothetical protein
MPTKPSYETVRMGEIHLRGKTKALALSSIRVPRAVVSAT